MAPNKRIFESPAVLRPLHKAEIDRMINELVADVASQFRDVKPVRISYLGEEILAIPMDTSRFVQVMGRYMVFN